MGVPTAKISKDDRPPPTGKVSSTTSANASRPENSLRPSLVDRYTSYACFPRHHKNRWHQQRRESAPQTANILVQVANFSARRRPEEGAEGHNDLRGCKEQDKVRRVSILAARVSVSEGSRLCCFLRKLARGGDRAGVKPTTEPLCPHSPERGIDLQTGASEAPTFFVFFPDWHPTHRGTKMIRSAATPAARSALDILRATLSVVVASTALMNTTHPERSALSTPATRRSKSG